MKVFIYIACFFVMVMIQVAAQNAGIILGAIPMVFFISVLIGLQEDYASFGITEVKSKS